MGGVTAFAANLVRGLKEHGVPARILVTDSSKQPGEPLALPADFAVEHALWRQKRSRRARWQALIRYLEENAPCVYLPNHDFEYACVSARLSQRVAVVGHLH